MQKLTIPRTLAAAVEELGALGSLLQAKEWGRAAILAAYVEPDNGHGERKETGSSASLESAAAFSRRGIMGLKSHHTVLHYVNTWLEHRDRPTPDEIVDLDGLPEWPPNKTVGRTIKMDDDRREALMAAGRGMGMASGSKVVDVAANPKSITAAIMADPETASVAKRALVERELVEMPAPARKLGEEYEKKTAELEEEENRHPNTGLGWALTCQKILDKMAKYGHIAAIKRVRDYAAGLVDADEASELTPEMFK